MVVYTLMGIDFKNIVPERRLYAATLNKELLDSIEADYDHDYRDITFIWEEMELIQK